jgi:hypothetical protein
MTSITSHPCRRRRTGLGYVLGPVPVVGSWQKMGWWHIDLGSLPMASGLAVAHPIPTIKSPPHPDGTLVVSGGAVGTWRGHRAQAARGRGRTARRNWG